MNYSKEEMVDMVFLLGECFKNCFLASRMYAERYPHRRHPNVHVFERVRERFERTGSINHERKERAKRTLIEENEFQVLASVVEDPHTSTRVISRQVDISHTSVARILRKHKFHPYHLQLLQELDNTDFANRLTFCQWSLNKIQQERLFFEYVLFTDEATFHKNGHVNRHNFHYYATENPSFTRTVHSQHRWSLNVWGGLIGNYIIGPYFFEERLTGPVYLDFLENHLQDLLEDVPLDIIRRLWVQHDGAPAHYSVECRDHLNNTFPGRWIGRGGPIAWPARSPDLTKMDFYLWGYIKDVVYRTPPTTKNNMKERIREAFRSVNAETLRSVSSSFVQRLQLCIRENGSHFEYLL